MFGKKVHIECLVSVIIILILLSCSSQKRKPEIRPAVLKPESELEKDPMSSDELDSLYFQIDNLLIYQSELFRKIDSLESELNIYQSLPVSAKDFKIPDTYYFAGYEIDLKNNRTSERFKKIFDKELRAAKKFIPLSGRYFPYFEKIFRKYNIPGDIKYLSIAESMLNPSATSHAGAAGIWQFMPQTAKGYNLTINEYIDERRNIFKSTEAAAKLLRDNHRTFLRHDIDDWLLAMCAYNAGAGNILKVLKSQGSDNFFKTIMRAEETDHYVYRSIAIKMIFENQELLFGRKFELMEPFEEMYKNVALTVRGYHEINQWAVANGTTVSDIHEINPWIRIYRQRRTRYSPLNKVILPPGQYNIMLPKEAVADKDLLAKAEKKLLNETSSHFVYYTIRSGDNLSTIARRHGTSIRKIKLLNNLSSNLIKPGQKLKVRGDIQPKSAKFHIVRQGENLSVIAKKYGVSVSKLRRLNDLGGDMILIGQRLIVSEKAERKMSASGSSANQEITHTVGRGDTLSGIALKYGVSIADIKAANNLRSDNIRAGDRLTVRTGSMIYTVVNGDNLSTIAGRFGTTASKIMQDNNLRSDRLSIGQKLVIVR